MQSEQEITTLELTDTYNAETRRGDLVMPEQDAMLPTLFYPTEGNEMVAGGKIVRVMGSIATAARNSVVTLNRGLNQGAKVGQVLDIYAQGESVKDPKTHELIKLPNQNIGSLMILKPLMNSVTLTYSRATYLLKSGQKFVRLKMKNKTILLIDL